MLATVSAWSRKPPCPNINRLPKPPTLSLSALVWFVHVVGRPGKAGTALNQLLDRRRPLIDRIALAVADKAAALPAGFEHRDVGGERVVARRIGERLGDDNRRRRSSTGRPRRMAPEPSFCRHQGRPANRPPGRLTSRSRKLYLTHCAPEPTDFGGICAATNAISRRTRTHCRSLTGINLQSAESYLLGRGTPCSRLFASAGNLCPPPRF